MKKIIILFAFILFVFASSAQKVYTITSDTLTAVETEYFTLPDLTGSYNSLVIQVLCTELGGTSDGTAVLQGSLDGTSYVTLTDATGVLKGYANDTLTISSGAVGIWVIDEPSLVKYRIAATGTADDTTLVTTKYMYKK